MSHKLWLIGINLRHHVHRFVLDRHHDHAIGFWIDHDLRDRVPVVSAIYNDRVMETLRD